jgi:hypothetical protein
VSNNNKGFYQVETNNASFVQMYETLKKIGINNNKFFLRLYDEELKDIEDIYNPPLEYKARIINEIKRNFWYFIREVVRIPVPGGTKPYELHRGNLALSWCLLKNLDTVLILPRQNYKTISACVFYLWLYLFKTKNSEMAFLNKSSLDSKANLQRVKDIKDLLPDYLQLINTREDEDNKTFMRHHITKNRIVAKPAANSEDGAINIGRGATQPCQWYDEFCFLKWNSKIFGSATPAFSQASREAKNHKKPFHRLITTTTGDLRTEQGIYAKRLFDNSAPFDDRMYDWERDEIDEYIETNSTNNFVFIQYTYKQIGRTEEWFNLECRRLNNQRSDINRELLLIWAKASDNSPFNQEDIDALYKYAKEPYSVITIDKKYPVTLYKNFDLTRTVLIGVDPAEGLLLDRTGISVVDALTMELIADFQSSKIDNVECADLLLKLGTLYFPNSIVIIETNKGKGIIDILSRTDLRSKMYYELKEKKAQFKQDEAGKKKSSTTKLNVYGVSCNKETRPQMLEILPIIIYQDYEKINSKLIIDDIAGLERKKTGRIEHSPVSFDDNLFSYLYARYIWVYGKNLGKFNIVKRRTDNLTALKDVMEHSEVMDKLSFIGNLNTKIDKNRFRMTEQIINEYQKNTINNKINEMIPGGTDPFGGRYIGSDLQSMQQFFNLNSAPGRYCQVNPSMLPDSLSIDNYKK